jgi:hypothetical protein
VSGSASVIAERMKPGAMQLTVMPREATSWRHRLGHSDQPGLGRGIIGLAGLPVVPTTEVIEMIRPKRARIIGLAAARARRNGGLEIDPDHLRPFLVLHPHG